VSGNLNSASKAANAGSNQVTVCVPERWREGRSHIKGFIEHYCQAVGKQVAVNLSADSAVKEIWIAEAGKLTRAEYEAADNAIQILNEGLIRAKNISWNNRPPLEKTFIDASGSRTFLKRCLARLRKSLGLPAGGKTDPNQRVKPGPHRRW
jgi:hypothetical protein